MTAAETKTRRDWAGFEVGKFIKEPESRRRRDPSAVSHQPSDSSPWTRPPSTATTMYSGVHDFSYALGSAGIQRRRQYPDVALLSAGGGGGGSLQTRKPPSAVAVHAPTSTRMDATRLDDRGISYSPVATTTTTIFRPTEDATPTRAAMSGRGQQGKARPSTRYDSYQRSPRSVGQQMTAQAPPQSPLPLPHYDPNHHHHRYRQQRQQQQPSAPPRFWAAEAKMNVTPSAATTRANAFAFVPPPLPLPLLPLPPPPSPAVLHGSSPPLNPAAAPFQPRGLPVAVAQTDSKDRVYRPKNQTTTATGRTARWTPNSSPPTSFLNPTFVGALLTQPMTPPVSYPVMSQWRAQAQYDMNWLQRELLAEGLAEDGSPLPGSFQAATAPAATPAAAAASPMGHGLKYRRDPKKKKSRYRRGCIPIIGIYPAIMEEDEQAELQRGISSKNRIVFRNPWIPRPGEVLLIEPHVDPLEQLKKDAKKSLEPEMKAVKERSQHQGASKRRENVLEDVDVDVTRTSNSRRSSPALYPVPACELFPDHVQDTGLNGDGLSRYPTFSKRPSNNFNFNSASTLDSRIPPTFYSFRDAAGDRGYRVYDARRNRSEPAVVGVGQGDRSGCAPRTRANTHAVDHLQRDVVSRFST
ncbi:hypothetical protein FRC16_005644, partial [Serendipita sp. 398]